MTQDVPVVDIGVSTLTPIQYWGQKQPNIITPAKSYTCTITGSPDGLDDLDLPMASFRAVLRKSSDSYIGCVIPNMAGYAAGIQARTNGELVISVERAMADGTIETIELARLDYGSFYYRRSTVSGQGTITGSGTVTVDTVHGYFLAGTRDRRFSANGQRKLTSAVNPLLRPGAYVQYGEDEIEAEEITFRVSPYDEIMEVSEAA